MITDIRDMTSFKWATVTGTSPLAIQLDGDTSALALIPDSLIDPLSLTVGDRVRVELSLRKVVVHGVANAGPEPGRVELTARAVAPTGWLLAQGQSLLRTSYQRLFDAIGTTYGAADSTHFTLPDTKGRVAIGSGTGSSGTSTNHPLGENNGQERHTLTTAEIPAHTHNTLFGDSAATGGTGNMYDAGYNKSHATSSTGGGGSHTNLQPYITLNYIIKI